MLRISYRNVMKTFAINSLALLIYMPSPAAEELLINPEKFENKTPVERDIVKSGVWQHSQAACFCC